MNYYKLKNNALIKAKTVERINGVWVSNPTAEQYAKIEAYPRSEESFAPPPCEEGYHAVADGYKVEDGKWAKKWRVAENPPPPPRVFSKLKAVLVLTEAGLWEHAKAYITEAGLYDLYLAANEFREDDPHFVQGLAALKSALSLTDEAVEALLAKCEA